MLGALVGATLGLPHRERRTYSPVNFFEPIPRKMSAHPVFEFWIAYKTLLASGVHPENLGAHISFSADFLPIESSFGLRNLKRGLYAPAAGAIDNPFSHLRGSMARAAVWGCLSETLEEACERAFFDASWDRAGERVWSAVGAAAMVWAATPDTPVSDLLDLLTSVLPAGHSAIAPIERARILVSQAKPLEEIYAAIMKGRRAEERAELGLSLVLLAVGLLVGQREFGLTMRSLASMGKDADETCTVAALILGGMGQGPDEEWLSPLGTDFIMGMHLQDTGAPATIEEFASMFPEPVTLTLVVTEPEPVVEEVLSEGVDGVVSPEPVSVVVSEAEVSEHQLTAPRLPSVSPRATRYRKGNLQMTVEYLNSYSLEREIGREIALTLTNVGPEAVELSVEFSADSPVDIATRWTSLRLGPGESRMHPVVVRQKEDFLPDRVRLRVQAGEESFEVPFFKPETWWSVGPLEIQHGQSLDYRYPAEMSFSLSEVFSGRSRQAAQWSPLLVGESLLDVESMMKGLPGVVLVGARLSFGVEEPIRMIVAGSPGVVVFVNGSRVLRYQDTHLPTNLPGEPYSVTLSNPTDVNVLLKFVRNEAPAERAAVYFLSAAGDIVRPLSVEPLTK
jgi:hypothetical protein